MPYFVVAYYLQTCSRLAVHVFRGCLFTELRRVRKRHLSLAFQRCGDALLLAFAMQCDAASHHSTLLSRLRAVQNVPNGLPTPCANHEIRHFLKPASRRPKRPNARNMVYRPFFVQSKSRYSLQGRHGFPCRRTRTGSRPQHAVTLVGAGTRGRDEAARGSRHWAGRLTLALKPAERAGSRPEQAQMC